MKRIFTLISIMTFALSVMSCSKEPVTPEDLTENPDKVATVSIKTKGEEYEDTVTLFRDANVYRTSDYEGQSWFCAMSGGKMVYDAFMLSLYFDCIDNLATGDMIDPSRCMFSFFYSSDINATTHEYKGTITLAGKGEDFAIFHFKNVLFKCSFGEYLIDGYLNCPLLEEHVSTINQ